MDEQEIGKRYSENGPTDNIMDLRFTKYFQRGSAKLRIFLEVKNLFNDRQVRRIDSETGEVVEVGKGSYKFTGKESERTIQGMIYRYSDPSFYGTPRNAKLGMGIEW